MKFGFSLSLLAFAVCCCTPVAARADTVFDLNATLTQAGPNPGSATLVGKFTFNTATGQLDQLTLTFTNPGANAYNSSYNLNNVFGGPTLGGPTVEYGITGYAAPYQASLFLYLPGSGPLIGYAGGPICSVAYACPGGPVSAISITGGVPVVNTSYTVTSGTLVAETPEPSSLMLMATGLVGLAGTVRRARNADSHRK